MTTNLLPATERKLTVPALPAHSAFTMPTSDLFYVPAYPTWTLDMTHALRRAEAEYYRASVQQYRYADAHRRHYVPTPAVIYATAGQGMVVQLELFESEGVAA